MDLLVCLSLGVWWAGTVDMDLLVCLSLGVWWAGTVDMDLLVCLSLGAWAGTADMEANPGCPGIYTCCR